MKVFLSWSGSRSKQVAEAFQEWLPNVIQAIQPWMSSDNIDKGARWSEDIATQLETTSFGIICLTPENLEAPWILFEAGALSKTLGKTFVCPYLYELESNNLKGPLVQFQNTRFEKEDTRKLIHTVNRALEDRKLADNNVNMAFDRWWPDFEARVLAIKQGEKKAAPVRSDRDMLEEILDLVRTQSRSSSDETAKYHEVLDILTAPTKDVLRPFSHRLRNAAVKPFIFDLLQMAGKELTSSEIHQGLRKLGVDITEDEVLSVLLRMMRDDNVEIFKGPGRATYTLRAQRAATDATPETE